MHTFVLHNLETLFPKEDISEKWTVLGRGRVYKTPKKEVVFFVVQKEGAKERFAVTLPENILFADSFTLSKNSHIFKIGIDSTTGGFKYYNHPLNNNPVPWRNSLVYTQHDNHWMVIEADGKAVE
jgi:hypothetical protein